jgi:PKD domain
MKTKVIGFFVCGLLIVNVSAVFGVSIDKITMSEKESSDIIVNLRNDQPSKDVRNFTTTREGLNNPPNTPITPSGATTGEVGISYQYMTRTTDPDGDDVQYGWDTEDGIIDFWTEYYSSGENCTVQICFLAPGIYHLRVKAKDVYGAESGFCYRLVVLINATNNKPNTPSKPAGPNSGVKGISYMYSTNTTDLDFDTVKYGWDWNGDGVVDEWTGLYPSGATVSTLHVFINIGIFYIKVIAEDEHGAQSLFSSTLTVLITSNPPNKPDRPNGSASGITGHLYSYQTSATDLDGDRLYYIWDWGEGNSSWAGPYNSGATCQASHIWNKSGNYNIKVKAKDIPGAESSWSDPLPITMPYSYKPSLQFLELLFQRFPNAFLLRLLMGY